MFVCDLMLRKTDLNLVRKQVDDRMVKGRYVWLLESPTASQEGWCWQYTVVDRYNTQVCEQSYAQVEGIGPLMRVMESHKAEFYFQEMITLHNERIARKLQRDGFTPSPASLFCVPGMCTPHKHVCQVMMGQPPPMAVPFFQTAGSDARNWE
jgi:hypothetical protein